MEIEGAVIAQSAIALTIAITCAETIGEYTSAMELSPSCTAALRITMLLIFLFFAFMATKSYNNYVARNDKA